MYRSGLICIYKSNCYEPDPDRLKPVTNHRKYSINKTKLRSACIAAWVNRRSKFMLFLTFTFPFKPDEPGAVKVWNLTLGSLRNTYKVKNYAWVKEFQTQNDNRIHYHIIVDRDRIDIQSLQASYNTAIKNIFPAANPGNNSVRLGKRPVVRDIKAVKNYLSKYVSKNDTVFNGRAYGFSEGLRLSRQIDPWELNDILQKFDRRQYYVVDDSFYRLIFLKDYIDSSP